ncbi:carbohydrate ABC transporter permease [[Mycoplasma] collis]|uniref:carbohydrate ABC transporter permease n=1 Tax=[Mycoplasma] collis TaxID=2127 RepID=UPI00051C12BD|nr:sugar ABC transporter permease [[Mycoplasma] collis]
MNKKKKNFLYERKFEFKNFNIHKSLFWFSLLILLLFLFLFNFLPLIYTIDDSLRIYNPISRLEYNYGLKNFEDVVKDPIFNQALTNSTILFFVATPIALLFSLFFAIILNSISSKITRNFWTTAIYSQFFVSSFAIGIVFIYLFGEKNIAFRFIFNSDFSFRGENKISILWLYLFFQIWRAIPFNTVLFSFSIQKAIKKYYKNIKIDNLSLYHKIKYVYFNEIKNSFSVILTTNLIFAFFIFPSAFVDYRLEEIQGHTLSSYIYNKFSPLNDTLDISFEKAASSSIISMLYILFLLLIMQMLLKFKKIIGFFKYDKKNI